MMFSYTSSTWAHPRGRNRRGGGRGRVSAPADRGVGRPAGRRRGPRGSTRPRTVSSWFVLKGVDMVSSSYTSTPKDQQSTAVVWPLHVSTGRARRGVVALSVSRARVDRAAGMGLRPRAPPCIGTPPGGPGRAGSGRRTFRGDVQRRAADGHRLLEDGPRAPEIDEHRVPVSVEHDVLRLDVPVRDVPLVEEVERVDDARDVERSTATDGASALGFVPGVARPSMSYSTLT